MFPGRGRNFTWQHPSRFSHLFLLTTSVQHGFAVAAFHALTAYVPSRFVS